MVGPDHPSGFRLHRGSRRRMTLSIASVRKYRSLYERDARAQEEHSDKPKTDDQQSRDLCRSLFDRLPKPYVRFPAIVQTLPYWAKSCQSLIPPSEFPLVSMGQSKLSTCFACACPAATRLYASTAFSNGTISIGDGFKTSVSKPGRSWSSISPICRGVSP